MIFQRAQVDGYGRFSGQSIDLSPGVQIVLGPNERGKSTLRAFLADMMYGQKLDTPGLYDEANLLRRPWQDHERYGGTLAYQLSDGRRFVVERSFDRDNELLAVRDAGSNEDITQQFDVLENGERDFARAHLGLTKAVYVNAATIGHFSLEGLGGRDALNKIREKLQSLADTGQEWHSSEAAVEALGERVALVGQPGDQTKPLPQLRARLLELERELESARTQRAEAGSLRQQLAGLSEQITQFDMEEARLRHELNAWERFERLRRAQRARGLHHRIEEITKQLFAFSSARDFPAHLEGQVQQQQMRKQGADEKLSHSRKEMHAVDRRIDEERQQLAGSGLDVLNALPEELELKYTELHGNVQRINERVSDIERALAGTEERLDENQTRLAALPDFSRIAADPVEWISQLASSFDVAVRARDEELETLEKLTEDVDERRRKIAKNHTLFKDHDNFPELAREHELERRVGEEQVVDRGRTLQAKRNLREDIRTGIPDLYWLGGICATGVAAVGITYAVLQLYGLVYLGGMLLIAALYFGGKLAYDRSRVKTLDEEIEDLERALRQAEEERPAPEESEAKDSSEEAEQSETTAGPPPDGVIGELLQQSGCSTVRELEALYDSYKEEDAELRARVSVFREQERKAEEAQERIPMLLDRFRETFENLGVSIEGEEDIKQAAGDAIAKYQEYREAKRNIADSHTAISRHQDDLKRLAEERAIEQEQLEEIEQQIREQLEDKGNVSTGDISATISGLRAALSERKEREARITVLEEQSAALTRQAKADEFDAQQKTQELDRLLAQAAVKSYDEWRQGLDEAKQYVALKEQRDTLNRELDAVAQGEDIPTLVRLAEDQPFDEEPGQSKEALADEVKRVSSDASMAREELHRVQIELTEKLSRGRPLNDIEEEHAWVSKRIELLQRELDAASYAMAIIEEVSRDKHARLAPTLEGRASGLLEQITGGAYSELKIAPDLSITLPLAARDGAERSPDNTLSKGTVDQIYLAIRVALVETLASGGEPAPMLFDDPFANYDDERLSRTMSVMRALGERHQILIFTCRDDVARAGRDAGVPVLEL